MESQEDLLHETEPNAPSDLAREQLAIMDVFWLVTAIAAIFAYARSWGDATVSQAIVYMVLVLVFGSTIGLVAQRFRDALFWAAISCLVAFIAVAGGNLPNEGVLIGWGSVGAICGALAGVAFPKSLRLAIPLSGATAVLAMIATLFAMQQPMDGLVQFDVLAAGVVGCLLRPFLQFLQSMEERTKQPRVVLAAWLTLVFLIGNYLVPIIGGVQR